jgi:predicted neuraminidase
LLCALPACDLATNPARTDPALTIEFDGRRAAQLEATSEATFLRVRAVFESLPGKHGSHAPTITALPDGELLAAWYSYEGPHELTDAEIFLARRPVAADAWSAPELRDDGEGRGGNPVLYSEGDNVWLFRAVVPLGWSAARIVYQRSSDRGHTWSPAAKIAGPVGANVRSPPVRIDEHTLLLPAYDNLLHRCIFFHSDTRAGWTLRSALATEPAYHCIQPSLARLPAGRLLTVMRNGGSGWLWVSASDDDGHSWAAPIDSGFENPAAPATLLPLASGNLLLVLNPSSAGRRPLAATLSADEGRSWTTPRILIDGPGEYAYPAAVQGQDGVIHILFSDDRARISCIDLNEAALLAAGE